MATRLARLCGGRSLQKVFPLYSTSATLSPSRTAEIPTSASTSFNEGSKKWGFSVLFLLLPCAATFGLGTWQLFRRQSKIELLDFRRKRLEEDPIALEDVLESWSGEDFQTPVVNELMEYRKVFCVGVYDEGKSLFVGPRARTVYGAAEKGYYMVTPMICPPHKDGRVQLPVLVNRGWVPASMRDAAISDATGEHPPDEKKGHRQDNWWTRWSKPRVLFKDYGARVAGVIRDGEHPNMFVPPNSPETAQWFYVDVPAMAHTLGLPRDTIYIEAVLEPTTLEGRKAFPLPKDPDAFLRSSVMPQDHLNYSLTWYSLSAATTFMAWKRLQVRR